MRYEVNYEYNGKKGHTEIPARNTDDLRRQLIDIEMGGYNKYEIYVYRALTDRWVFSGTMTKKESCGQTYYVWDNGRRSYNIRDDGSLYR